MSSRWSDMAEGMTYVFLCSAGDVVMSCNLYRQQERVPGSTSGVHSFLLSAKQPTVRAPYTYDVHVDVVSHVIISLSRKC